MNNNVNNPDNPMDLTGRHVIVTGASAGIGRAACIQASKLGARVSLVARNAAKLDETLSFMTGTGHDSYVQDLAEIDAIDSLIAKIATERGAIDGLVHCAGMSANRMIKFSKPEFVEQIARINYFAFVELVRAAAAKKRSNDGASYVGISSVAAVRGDKTQGAYSASKGALNALVHVFAKELSVRKIRVNTVAFGMVDTDMYKSFLETGGNNEELLREQYLGIISPEYAAKAICFLLSDAAKYMTGGTLNYDAGVLS